MKPFSRRAGLAALAVLVTSAGPLEAAWNNVFQVTCHRRRAPQVSAGFIAAPAFSSPAACCNPCPPPPVCTTQYVQRCYYQPETTWRTETRYEAVTTWTTRYFCEPVTTYRYSCYIDPCTGCAQKVATPVVSYQMRAQSCPVQTWVARCYSVPVTVQRQVCCWVPQTSCCQPGAAPAPAATMPPPPPGVGEQRSTPPPPVIKEGNGTQQREQFYGPSFNSSPPRQLPPGNPAAQPAPQGPAPGVKLERIVLNDGQRLQGQVVRADSSPQGHATVLFVSAAREAPNQTATANGQGQFEVELPRGGWLVYVAGADGRQTFHSRIDVDGSRTPELRLTSR